MNAMIAVAWHCLLESRPVVQVVFLLRLLSGWALTVVWPHHRSVVTTLAGIVSWFCVVMAVYLLNGVTDQREDRVNESSRPIATGRLAGVTAEYAVWVLAVAGVLAGFAVSTPLGVLAVVALIVGWLYSAPPLRLKRWSAGTVATALTGIGLTYYAGAVLAIAPSPMSSYLPRLGLELALFAGALSLWAALVGGTTKDLPDAAGDRAMGSRSWLLVWGERRFRWVVAGIALLIGAAFGAAAVWLAPSLIPVAGVLLAGGLAVSALLLVPLRRSRRESGQDPAPSLVTGTGIGHDTGTGAPRSARGPYRAFMSTQYAAHLVLLTRQLTAIVD